MVDIDQESVVDIETHLDGKPQQELENEGDGEVLKNQRLAVRLTGEERLGRQGARNG